MMDIKEIVKVLRKEDQQEADALGVNPEKALFGLYRYAVLRKTAFVDNQIAALWGVVGTPLGIVGRPYLITGQAVELVSPLTFARIYRKEVVKMQELFPVLEQYVDASYTGSVKMIQLAGFSLNGEINTGPNKTMFYKFTRKAKE